MNAVCNYLCSNGYEINQQLKTHETGIDIIATSPTGTPCFVEAKGATSSKPSTSRYGKEFDRSQVKTHIGMALVASFRMRQKHPAAEVIMALPKNQKHESLINEMHTSLSLTGVKVLLVAENGTVETCI